MGLERSRSIMKNQENNFLIKHFGKVDECIRNNVCESTEFPDVLISFCFVVEKILKIKLYKKNPVLVFHDYDLKNEDNLIGIVLEKEETLKTIKMGQVIDRFRTIFEKELSEVENTSLDLVTEIYELRSFFSHSHKSDDKITFDQNDLIKKMATVWELISRIAVELFGRNIISNTTPLKKYTEEELQEILDNEVREIIKPITADTGPLIVRNSRFYEEQIPLVSRGSVYGLNTYLSGGEQCPRCGLNTLLLDNFGNDSWSVYGISSTLSAYPNSESGLYKCSNCQLQLTPSQYERAKNIITRDRFS